jgi:hypothetical protein
MNLGTFCPLEKNKQILTHLYSVHVFLVVGDPLRLTGLAVHIMIIVLYCINHGIAIAVNLKEPMLGQKREFSVLLLKKNKFVMDFPTNCGGFCKPPSVCKCLPHI